MASRLSAQAKSDTPSLVSVAGALWLISAVIAGRRTDRTEAYRRLDEGERLAEMLGHDANFAWTAFGPTNVAIHRVSVAAELGDAREALEVATAVDPDALPVGLNGRRAQVYLDLAWAQAQRKRDSEAILHLLEAERVAPNAIRYNVLVREMVREMLTRSKRSKFAALHNLAVRAGVLDWQTVGMPVAALVVCGAPLTQRTDDMVRALLAAGWETRVVGTPSSKAWLDAAARVEFDIRFDFRSPDQAKRTGPVDAVIVCPATFNTLNKIVAGTADNYAVSFVCEAVGEGVPTVMVPMVNQKLWGHFGWRPALEALTRAGVKLLDIRTGTAGSGPVQSGTGEGVVQDFDPTWLVKALEDS
jgi:Flavoprotein